MHEDARQRSWRNLQQLARPKLLKQLSTMLWMWMFPQPAAHPAKQSFLMPRMWAGGRGPWGRLLMHKVERPTCPA